MEFLEEMKSAKEEKGFKEEEDFEKEKDSKEEDFFLKEMVQTLTHSFWLNKPNESNSLLSQLVQIICGSRRELCQSNM